MTFLGMYLSLPQPMFTGFVSRACITDMPFNLPDIGWKSSLRPIRIRLCKVPQPYGSGAIIRQQEPYMKVHKSSVAS